MRGDLLKRNLQACMAALMVAGLWGCESMPETRTTSPAAEVAKPAAPSAQAGTEGWAVGRIAVIDKKGKEVEFKDSIWTMSQLSVWVLSQQTGAMQKHRVLGDGSFVWQLEPGKYVLAGFSGTLADSGARLGRIWAEFEVKPAPHAAYVGTVVVNFVDGYYRVGLRDDHARLSESVRERMASAGREAEKALFDFAPRLGNYESMSGICAEEWGIDCGVKFAGVEPLSPESSSGTGFPEAGSVLPVFEWKPVGQPGLTYDFALYETVAMPGAAMGGRIRGELVAYAEGLREPRFQLATPLEHGRKYEWSVRLRQGSKVSTWSTTGYFAFFVVGFASGHGYWFQFSTP